MNLNKYIEILKTKYKLNVENHLLEKDYMLSLFLSNWAKEDTPNLNKLIFKGGTLLTKNYLKYHRISEDLDFIHQDSNEIRKIKTKQKQETQIKNRVLLIIEEVKKIANLSNLDFQTDRTNERYIILRNSRKLYIFNLYYKSQITKKEDNIKFEISFAEDFINLSKKEEIQNITNYYQLEEMDMRLINYNLQKPKLQIYQIDEIILEKLRATITREQFKPRDVFDLFLINKQKNIFNQKKEDLFRKLKASPFEFEYTLKNINNFLKEEISIDLDEIYGLSLIEFDENKFIDFTNKLINYLKQIAEEFIEEIK